MKGEDRPGALLLGVLFATPFFSRGLRRTFSLFGSALPCSALVLPWRLCTLADLVSSLLPSAAYYVAFGPHGPRTPVNPPGTSAKVTAGVFGLIAAAAAVFATVRALGKPRHCVSVFRVYAALTCACPASASYLPRSAAPAEDDHEGVGRCRAGARARDEHQPYLWYVRPRPTPVPLCLVLRGALCSLSRGFFLLRCLVGRVRRQGLQHAQVDRGRALRRDGPGGGNRHGRLRGSGTRVKARTNFERLSTVVVVLGAADGLRIYYGFLSMSAGCLSS